MKTEKMWMYQEAIQLLNLIKIHRRHRKNRKRYPKQEQRTLMGIALELARNEWQRMNDMGEVHEEAQETQTTLDSQWKDC